jgi:hypothetical protein
VEMTPRNTCDHHHPAQHARYGVTVTALIEHPTASGCQIAENTAASKYVALVE